LTDRPHVIADVQRTRRLNAGQNTHDFQSLAKPGDEKARRPSCVPVGRHQETGKRGQAMGSRRFSR
jgi:hypothetical protein